LRRGDFGAGVGGRGRKQAGSDGKAEQGKFHGGLISLKMFFIINYKFSKVISVFGLVNSDPQKVLAWQNLRGARPGATKVQ
jgi:hypothetical protein